MLIVIPLLLTYGKNRNNVFKDKYMQNIFIDEEGISVENSNYEYYFFILKTIHCIPPYTL